jgi:hypothetical protein
VWTSTVHRYCVSAAIVRTFLTVAAHRNDLDSAPRYRFRGIGNVFPTGYMPVIVGNQVTLSIFMRQKIVFYIFIAL